MILLITVISSFVNGAKPKLDFFYIPLIVIPLITLNAVEIRGMKKIPKEQASTFEVNQEINRLIQIQDKNRRLFLKIDLIGICAILFTMVLLLFLAYLSVM